MFSISYFATNINCTIQEPTKLDVQNMLSVEQTTLILDMVLSLGAHVLRWELYVLSLIAGHAIPTVIATLFKWSQCIIFTDVPAYAPKSAASARSIHMDVRISATMQTWLMVESGNCIKH